MRFGIIGTNWITEKFIEAGKMHDDFELTAIYSRTYETAKRFTDKYHVDNIYNSLEEMATSKTIDAVYIASPNSFHAEQAILFLSNNVAVLCEKPVASNYNETLEIIETAKRYNVLFMEAMKFTFIPSYQKIKESISLLGNIRQVAMNYCQYSSRYDRFKQGEIPNAFNAIFSNGSLMDIGVYPIFFIISIFGVPKNIQATAHLLHSGVDGNGTIIFEYDSFHVSILHSKINNSYLPSQIMGENGALIIEHVSDIEKVTFIDRVQNISLNLTEEREENGMFYEVKEFIELYKSNQIESSINTFQLSLDVMKTLDKIRRQIGVVFPADFHD